MGFYRVMLIYWPLGQSYMSYSYFIEYVGAAKAMARGADSVVPMPRPAER